jgi:hypothetical protein
MQENGNIKMEEFYRNSRMEELRNMLKTYTRDLLIRE